MQFLVNHQEKLQDKCDAQVEFASTPGGTCAYAMYRVALPTRALAEWLSPPLNGLAELLSPPLNDLAEWLSPPLNGLAEWLSPPRIPNVPTESLSKSCRMLPPSPPPTSPGQPGHASAAALCWGDKRPWCHCAVKKVCPRAVACFPPTPP